MRTGRPKLPPPVHGSRARYAHRSEPCKCDECRRANARYQSAYRGRPTRGYEQLEIPASAYERITIGR